MADTKDIVEVLDILARLKALLGPEPDPYLPVWGALGGAFIGAVSTFIPSLIIQRAKDKRERAALTLAIYSEIKSSLNIIEARRYFTGVKSILKEFEEGKRTSATFQIIAPDDYCIVYKNNVTRIGVIDPLLQIKIVQFYQMVDAIVQDVKPGGILNSSPAGREPFHELLEIGSQMLTIGSEIIDEVERRYRIKTETNGTGGS